MAEARKRKCYDFKFKQASAYQLISQRRKKKQLYGPFLLWMGFRATATSKMQFTSYHSVPRNSWYSFYRPRKDQTLSRPWSHPVVLVTGPLNWESSALTTRPLLHKCVAQATLHHSDYDDVDTVRIEDETDLTEQIIQDGFIEISAI